MQGQLEGKTRIRELYKTWLHAFPDLTFTSSDILIDGNRAVQFFTLTGTQAAAFGGVAATGRRIQFNGAWLYEFDEAGLITHSRLLYDVTNVLVQLGALKTKPGA
jgi:predicted ester cyclase